MKKIGILMMVLMAVGLIVKAQQDPQFSQNMFNHMTVNPAFAGQQNRWVVSGIYRNQWQGMEGAPETYALNVDGALRIGKTNGGVGLNMLSDKLGLQTTLQLMLNYSYQQTLRLGVLSVGIKLGVLNEKLGADYYFPEGEDYEPNDPALNKEEMSKMLFDMGMGAFLTGKSYYAGISVSRVGGAAQTKGVTGEFFFAPHLYLTGGYTFHLSPLWDLQPSAFVKTDFVSSQYSVNTSAVYKQSYWGGISYRYEEALIFMGGLEMKNGIMIGYSYDLNVAKNIGRYTGGSHEVTLSYSFGMQLGKRQKIYKSVRFL